MELMEDRSNEHHSLEKKKKNLCLFRSIWSSFKIIIKQATSLNRKQRNSDKKQRDTGTSPHLHILKYQTHEVLAYIIIKESTCITLISFAFLYRLTDLNFISSCHIFASATDYKNVKSGEGNQDPTLPPLESLKAKATRNRHRRRERMELLIGLKCHQLAWKKQCITGFTTYPLNRGFDLGQKHVHVKFIIIVSHSIRKKKVTLQKKSFKCINGYLFWVGFGMLGGILLKLASVCLSGFFASPCKLLSVWECGFCISNLLAWPPLRLLISWEIDREEQRRSMSITAVRAGRDLEYDVMGLLFFAGRMRFSEVEVRWKLFSIVYRKFWGFFLMG